MEKADPKTEDASYLWMIYLDYLNEMLPWEQKTTLATIEEKDESHE